MMSFQSPLISQPVRQRLATFMLCSGSGLIENGSIDSTIGRPVRFRAPLIAPKRTEESMPYVAQLSLLR